MELRTATKEGKQAKTTEYDKINALFIFWRWASTRYEVKNAMALLKRPKQPEPHIKAITPEDFAKMYKVTERSLAGARDRALLCWLGSTGTRAGETISLRVDDIDLQKRRATIRKTKNGKARIVRFSKWTALLLRYWLGIKPNGSFVFSRIDGKPLTYNGLRQTMRRLAIKAGVEENWQPHRFRHFSVIESLLQGGEITQISKQVGHADISSTVRHYANFRPDDLDMMDDHDALRSVFGGRNVLSDGKI